MKALSPTDSVFLWIETRSQPMHVAGLNLYTPPDGAGPDFVAGLMAKWREHTDAPAPFNQRPVLKLGRWFWETDDEFELDHHLRHLALPRPGRIRELLALVSQLHATLLDRNRPLWEIYVIEGLPGGRFATYSKIHHALVDGVSGAKMMAQALAPTAHLQKPPLWAQVLGKPPRPAESTATASLFNALTVNDVTLAICAGAVRRNLLAHEALPKLPLIAMVPVSLHGEANNGGEAGGNQVGILLANLTTDVADPLARLEKVAHAAALMAPAAPSVLSGDARKRPLFNVVISNVPGPHDLLYLNGARLDEVYPVSIPTHFLALNITISGYGDKLGFGYIACRRSVPAMQRLLDHTEQSIAELESALCPPATRAARARKTPVPKSAARTSKAAPAASPRAARLRKTPA